MRDSKEIILVKLGGSLITDKSRPKTARSRVIARLAGELQRAAERSPSALVVGHGSGSFGHVAAAAAGLHRGVDAAARPHGVSATQHEAFELHRRVVSALREAGMASFSLAPSSFLVASGGQPAALWPEPLLLALRSGLLPVVFGDVVMDRERGAAVCSTESLFQALVPALGSRGAFVRRVVWLGETDGILDRRGRTIPEVSARHLPKLAAELEGAAGIDVTGGIRHRLLAAAALAGQGIGSWIGNGLRPGALVEGLQGTAEHGTRVLPGRDRRSR